MQGAGEHCQQAEPERHGSVERTQNGLAGLPEPQRQQLVEAEGSHRQLGQHQHDDQRQVLAPRANRVEIRRQHVAGEHVRRLVTRCRHGDAGRRHAGQEGVALRVFDGRRLVDDANGDGLVGACLRAGRGLPIRQPPGAHVALAHDAEPGAVLRHLVRAGENAVPAADALVVQVMHDTGQRVLFVGAHRATVHAGWLQAVVARGDRLLHRLLRAAAVQQADRTPRLAPLQTVQAVAGGDARLAAGTAVEVHLETVLLSFSGR